VAAAPAPASEPSYLGGGGGGAEGNGGGAVKVASS
jgi:hypothetical protein